MVVVHSHEELAAAFAADEREISIQPWDWDEGRPFEVGEEGKGNGCYFEARGNSMVHVKGYCFVRAMCHSRVWTLSPSGCRIEALRDSVIYNVEFCRADLFDNSSLDASGRTDAARELHALHPQAVSDFRPESQRSVPVGIDSEASFVTRPSGFAAWPDSDALPPASEAPLREFSGHFVASSGGGLGDRFMRIEPGTPIRFIPSWNGSRGNPVAHSFLHEGDDHCPICDHFKMNPVERKEAPTVVVFDRPDEIFFDDDDVL